MRYLPIFALLFVFACETPPSEDGRLATDGDYSGMGSQNAGVPAGELAPGVFDTVYFATDSSTLNSEAQGVLRAQAEWLKANPSLNILVEGHCDERASREYNLALGDRRANAVTTYLKGLGVDAGRVETISYGKERPVANGSDAESWAINRRGVTVVQ
jgi:peptidoglycan-associated lipoprotein